MQAHVKQRVLALPEQRQRRLKVARRQHTLEQLAWQGLARVDLSRQALQHRPLPAEVFHELAGQFNGIAFDPGDARHRQVFDLRQQVMQAVAELVEQRDHVVVRQQRGPPAHRRRKVADQVRQRFLQRALRAPPATAAAVHPGAGLLAFAGVQVQVEARHGLVSAPDAEEANAVVPDRRCFCANRHVEQRFDQLEKALQHARFGEVLTHLFAAEGVVGLFELFRGKGAVPGLQVRQTQLLPRKLRQGSQLLLGVRAGTRRQIAHKRQHGGRRAGHVVHHGQVRIGLKAQQPGFFQPQFKQFLHRGRVVQFGGAKLAGAGDVGAVQLVAQVAVERMRHHRQVARRPQRQLVAITLLGKGRGACGLAHVFGHALHLRIGGPKRKSVGGVQHPLTISLRQRTGPLLDAGVALARCALQFSAAQHKVTQRVAHHPASGRRKQRPLAGRDGLVLGVEPFVGAHAGAEVDDAAQVVAVFGAHFRRVCNPLQVGYMAPGGHQPLDGHVEQQGQRVVVGLLVAGHHALQRRFGVAQQNVQRWRDVGGLDVCEGGLGIRFQQRVHCASWAACSVLTSSMVMVIGPTPPGTGLIQPLSPKA